MTDTLDVIVRTREDAHTACRQGYALAQALLMDGKRVHVLVSEDDEPVSVKQHKFFHGPCLQQISEQVRVNGELFTRDIWRRHLKNLILERKPRYEMVKLPGQKRATPRRKYWSLTELGVKRYSLFIDEAIAIAASEWGVVFHFITEERDAVRYVAPARKKSDSKEAAVETN